MPCKAGSPRHPGWRVRFTRRTCYAGHGTAPPCHFFVQHLVPHLRLPQPTNEPEGSGEQSAQTGERQYPVASLPQRGRPSCNVHKWGGCVPSVARPAVVRDLRDRISRRCLVLPARGPLADRGRTESEDPSEGNRRSEGTGCFFVVLYWISSARGCNIKY